MSSKTGTFGNVEGIDVAIIVAYFAIVMSFGLWSSFKNRGSVGGYFLAGRSMHFVLIGASLFASNIGSGHFIGLAGSGASTGIGIAVFEVNAIFILLLLGWVFVPVYIASGVFTMPEYLHKRFGGQRIRVYLAILALLLSIFTKVAADLFAGALFLTQAFNLNIYASIIVLLAVAAMFSIAGGLTAVIWTDFIQTIVMLIGAFYLMIVSFLKVGGFEALKNQFLHAIPNTTIGYRMRHDSERLHHCGIPPSNAFHLFRSVDDPNQPWTGVFFGLTISGIWYCCTDQVMVQRSLAAKTYSHAKAGCVMAGYLKFLPMWLMVIPGMIARILYADEIGCADAATCEAVCGSAAGCTNIAYPFLVIRLMPSGARGLMLAAMMSALMSSLTSVFNSSSTIFTVDVWMRMRPVAGDVEKMTVSRVFVLVMTAIGITWIPIVQNFSELFNYIQSVTSYLAPPICAVYLLAVLWPRTNEQGAFWGLMVGLVIGVTRFIWESSYAPVPCGSEADDPRPSIIKDVHYLHFGVILFVVVFAVVVSVSLLTKPIAGKHIERLLFWNRYSTTERVDFDAAAEKVKTKVHPSSDNTSTDKTSIKPETQRLDRPRDLDSRLTLDTNDLKPENVKDPYWRTAVNWICGIEKHPELELTDEEKAEIVRIQTSLDEIPLHKKLCDINAIALMTFAVFFWTFFA